MPKAESLTSGDYTAYQLQRVYDLDMGIVQEPVAGLTDGTQEAAFVRVHSPIETMCIIWTASREGGIPTLPHPTKIVASDTNLVFLRQVLSPNAPVILPSLNGHTVIVSGQYYYGLKKPRAIASAIPTGRIPGDSLTSPSYEIPASAFSDAATGYKG